MQDELRRPMMPILSFVKNNTARDNDGLIFALDPVTQSFKRKIIMNIAPLFDLTGKVAVVTGGGNGIGRASARILAQAGADVVIADMKQDDAQQVADEIETTGRRAIAIACNVGKEEQLQNLVERTLDVFGKLNILVNNVGIGGGGRENPFKITLADFERVYDINVFSTWRLCQLAVPHMKASSYGSIVNISSMSSINSSPDMSAYASSKAAINHMTANLAFDFAPEVRINAVAPGAIETQALASVLTPEIKERMLARTPLKRLGKAEDIAGAVLFLAAPVSAWITGQVLFVNGGGKQTLD